MKRADTKSGTLRGVGLTHDLLNKIELGRKVTKRGQSHVRVFVVLGRVGKRGLLPGNSLAVPRKPVVYNWPSHIEAPAEIK